MKEDSDRSNNSNQSIESKTEAKMGLNNSNQSVEQKDEDKMAITSIEEFIKSIGHRNSAFKNGRKLFGKIG